MRIELVLILISMMVLIAVASMAGSQAIEDRGAKNIELEGGKRGKVPFPHRQHQEKLSDCQICHSTFPQELGAIEDLKKKGTLKKKYVMNKHCTKCHKEKKKAGQQSGPTTCSKCHFKQKN